MTRTANRPRRASTPSLRDRLHETTRELIIDALVAQLGDTGAFEFSYFEVARRAGVSVRTVYRHFPTREALFDAISQRINAVVGFHDYPRTHEGIVALTRNLFPAFDANEPLIRAQLHAGLGNQVRQHARKERVSAVQQAVQSIAPDLDPERRRLLAGTISVLLSANTWVRMREDLGVDGTKAGEATAWAIDVLCKALAAENELVQKRRRRGGKETR